MSSDLNYYARRSREGDRQAQEQLLTQLRPLIRSRASGTHIPGMEAEDVEQEIALALLAKVDGWDPSRPFLPYAYRVVENAVKMLLRASLQEKRRIVHYAVPIQGAGNLQVTDARMQGDHSRAFDDNEPSYEIDFDGLVEAREVARVVYEKGTETEIAVAEMRADGYLRKEIEDELGLTVWGPRQALASLRRKVKRSTAVAGHRA